jgi:hypothetical protein
MFGGTRKSQVNKHMALLNVTYSLAKQLTKYSGESSPVMSDSMNPGQMAFTVIPRLENSFALLIVSPRTPPLAAA